MSNVFMKKSMLILALCVGMVPGARAISYDNGNVFFGVIAAISISYLITDSIDVYNKNRPHEIADLTVAVEGNSQEVVEAIRKAIEEGKSGNKVSIKKCNVEMKITPNKVGSKKIN